MFARQTRTQSRKTSKKKFQDEKGPDGLMRVVEFDAKYRAGKDPPGDELRCSAQQEVQGDLAV
ncbi:MAG: hypothetical protein ACLR4Z_17030 [Butyricicoccaceae bacterium]